LLLHKIFVLLRGAGFLALEMKGDGFGAIESWCLTVIGWAIGQGAALTLFIADIFEGVDEGLAPPRAAILSVHPALFQSVDELTWCIC
jgi:hypothetical protein